MVVAKSEAALSALSARFAARDLERAYLGLCWGVPNPDQGEIEGAIGRDPRDRKRMKAVRTTADAGEEPPAGTREARTLYELEREWFALGLALLRCRLVTGRTHQIRVHLAAAGLPIVGDPVYGRPRYPRVGNGVLKARLQAFPRQALHAERIAFHHPVTQELIEVVAPVPQDLQDLLRAIEEASR
jgi:23S rRNA pseudouridine1911/1915/1917 synthase